MPSRQCKICQVEFTPATYNAVFCGGECEKAHRRAKWKANYATNPAFRERYMVKARALSKRPDVRKQKIKKRCEKLRAATAERRAQRPLRFGENQTMVMWEAHKQERRIVARLDRMWMKHPVRMRHNGAATAKRTWRRHRHNPQFRMLKALRSRLWKFANGMKYTPMRRLVGCTQDQLMEHLAKQFKRGMTRANYGEWEIDHIVPCTHFDLTNAQHQSQCFHYLNLQPLWKADNVRKSNKVKVSIQMHLPIAL